MFEHSKESKKINSRYVKNIQNFNKFKIKKTMIEFDIIMIITIK